MFEPPGGVKSVEKVGCLFEFGHLSQHLRSIVKNFFTQLLICSGDNIKTIVRNQHLIFNKN